MKKLGLSLLLILTVVSVFASTYTHTIVIRCRVREVLPTFTLQPTEEGIAVYQATKANTLRSISLTLVCGGLTDKRVIQYNGYTPPKFLYVVKTKEKNAYLLVDIL